jgi:hypothetical protein
MIFFARQASNHRWPRNVQGDHGYRTRVESSEETWMVNPSIEDEMIDDSIAWAKTWVSE